MLFIVLDLDETLLHTLDVTKGYNKKLDKLSDFNFKLKNGNSYDYYWVKKRPGLDIFLEFVFKYFVIGIWTAGVEDYAKEICKRILTLNQLKKIKFIYSRNFCKIDTNNNKLVFTKPLSKIFEKYPSMEVSNTIVIDNSEHTFKHNIRNGVKIKDFLGSNKDNSLFMLRNLIIRYYQKAPRNNPIWALIYHLNTNMT